MIEWEASLSVDLDGQRCLTVQTEARGVVVRFESADAFRRAIRTLRRASVPSGRALPPALQRVLTSQRAVLCVGEEEVAEILPGEPPSLAVRLLGLDIPGLRLRGGRLARLLLG